MSPNEVLKDLKSKKYAPLYLLQGEEPYFIDVVSDFFEQNVLLPEEIAFNQTLLYGKEATWQLVVDNARQMPFIGDRKLIIVKEAQAMKDMGELHKYAERPAPHTIVVLCYKYGTPDKRSKAMKTLIEKAVVVDSKKLYDNQLPEWINNYLKEKNIKIAMDNALLIADSLGNDLSKIANELGKLALNIPAGTEATKTQIQDFIGISKDFNVFELQAALSKRDTLKVFRIVDYFTANPKDNPLVLLLGALFTYFGKVYIAASRHFGTDDELAKALNMNYVKFVAEYRVAAKNYPKAKTEQIIILLSEYDLKSKGVESRQSDGALLRELIWKILYL